MTDNEKRAHELAIAYAFKFSNQKQPYSFFIDYLDAFGSFLEALNKQKPADLGSQLPQK